MVGLEWRNRPSLTRLGFLLRPFAIALALGAAGSALSALEERTPAIGSLVPAALLTARGDPQIAQAILTDIATSVMTVVSIVFAILLMTLTLASTQFSPRILISFTRDRVTQWTLGVFLGTFSYCIAALPAAHSMPHPFVPVLTARAHFTGGKQPFAPQRQLTTDRRFRASSGLSPLTVAGTRLRRTA
jgi:uncharacterized membrane protein